MLGRCALLDFEGVDEPSVENSASAFDVGQERGHDVGQSLDEMDAAHERFIQPRGKPAPADRVLERLYQRSGPEALEKPGRRECCHPSTAASVAGSDELSEAASPEQRRARDDRARASEELVGSDTAEHDMDPF